MASDAILVCICLMVIIAHNNTAVTAWIPSARISSDFKIEKPERGHGKSNDHAHGYEQRQNFADDVKQIRMAMMRLEVAATRLERNQTELDAQVKAVEQKTAERFGTESIRSTATLKPSDIRTSPESVSMTEFVGDVGQSTVKGQTANPFTTVKTVTPQVTKRAPGTDKQAQEQNQHEQTEAYESRNELPKEGTVINELAEIDQIIAIASGLVSRHKALSHVMSTEAVVPSARDRQVVDTNRRHEEEIPPVLQALIRQARLIEHGGLPWLSLKKFQDYQED